MPENESERVSGAIIGDILRSQEAELRSEWQTARAAATSPTGALDSYYLGRAAQINQTIERFENVHPELAANLPPEINLPALQREVSVASAAQIEQKKEREEQGISHV